MKRAKHFATEADLCVAFIAWAKVRGYICYPETSGWDILMVDAEGRQTGVEAKLDLNLKVISQAMKESWYREGPGPDHRAVLVPETREGVEPILATCGIHLYVPQSCAYTTDAGMYGLKWKFDAQYHEPAMFDWNPSVRCAIPEFMPDVPCGVPSPRTLSPWKVGALRVLALLELKGWVNRDDIRASGNDPRRWCASDGYLMQLGEGRWGRKSTTPTFDIHHPTVYAEIRNETAKKLGLPLVRVKRPSQA